MSYLSARAICKQVMLMLIDESDEIEWLVKLLLFFLQNVAKQMLFDWLYFPS